VPTAAATAQRREIDVDDYGRVVYTDQGRSAWFMLDTAGNEVLTFGRYGNQDSSAATEIGFDWFVGLGLTDHNVYGRRRRQPPRPPASRFVTPQRRRLRSSDPRAYV